MSQGISPLGLFKFYETDAITNIDREIDKPNSRYEPTYIGTWSSISDVDVFCNRFNHSNNYKDGDTKIGLGDYVTIQDGTYNSIWMVAGFDMESNQIAADETVFDNGYGICLIPKSYVTNGIWNNVNVLDGAYMSSKIHSTISTIVSNLENVLGDHMVSRNVLLSNSVDSSKKSNGYTWTTEKATLMSVGQLTGTFKSNSNLYDDGEANYKLPIFDMMSYSTDYSFWTRGISGKGSDGCYVYFVGQNEYIGAYYVHNPYCIRPLIYLR